MSIIFALLCQLVPAPELPDPEPVQADSRKLVIVYDDSRESRMILAELNRDWHKYGLRDEYLVQVYLLAYTETVRNTDRFSLQPKWKYGTGGKLNEFDPRTFHDTARPLHTLHAIHQNCVLDLSGWKQSCERLQDHAEREHCNEATKWLRIAAPDRLNDIPHYEWGLADNIRFLSLEREFGAAGYPAYVPPVLPARPTVAMPWEK